MNLTREAKLLIVFIPAIGAPFFLAALMLILVKFVGLAPDNAGRGMIAFLAGMFGGPAGVGWAIYACDMFGGMRRIIEECE